MNELVTGFWTTSSRTLSVRPRSGLEIGRLQPISGDAGNNGKRSISFPESSGLLVSGWALGCQWIGHFRVHLSLHFKTRLSAKSLLWKSVFIHIETGTNYHDKNFAPRLALKERLRGTRKWPIQSPHCILFSLKRRQTNFFPCHAVYVSF